MIEVLLVRVSLDEEGTETIIPNPVGSVLGRDEPLPVVGAAVLIHLGHGLLWRARQGGISK